MQEKINYRSAGRATPISGVKFKSLDGPKLRSSPSVPGKWETRVVLEKDKIKGFGSTRNRFSQDEKNDIPGPGYYNDEPSSVIMQGPSLSKKGYGNAFLSVKPKIDFVPDKTTIPGPGEYETKPSLSVKKVCKYGSPAFADSANGRVPFDCPPSQKIKVGPGEYNIEHAEQDPYYARKRNNATFLSKVPRASQLILHSDAPPVATYNPSIKVLKDDSAVEWSKSKHKRFQDIAVDNKVPGPWRYFDKDKDEEEEERRKRESLRLLGKFKGPLVPRIASIQSPRSARGTPGFGIHEKERFKHSFLKDLQEHQKYPGPGWYDPLPKSPDRVGDANTWRLLVSERGSVSAPLRRELTAQFRSSAPSRGELLRPLSQRNPGPAYYDPVKPSSKKFNVNMDGRWE